uniref:SAP domain-containing protein n=1 Tax=viral metagenome TaxID=1070528 RepID=A0A6C0BBR6_9ZZZZ
MKESISIEKYLNTIYSKCEINASVIKNAKKVEEDNLITPTIHEWHLLIVNNYNQKQLKQFAKEYKLKVSGNKGQLVERLFSYLKLSSIIVKIQKQFRGFLQRKYNNLHGPAYLKRQLCTNDSDFLTGDDLAIIPFEQFFSFKDNDNFIYGFDVVSLYNLIIKSGKHVKNPYNRNIISPVIIAGITKLLRVSKALNIKVNIDVQDISQEITQQKSLELRTLDLFQNIDALGNYSNPQWFLDLNRIKLVKFIRDLTDIWEYRAQLTIETKKLICPPNGTPFRNLHGVTINHEQQLNSLRNIILDILEKMVNSGVDADSKALGAYYVLAALTLVNETAANALPWLFQSVS